ncbi:MAG: OmpA family protein [Magnetospirillum sp.]|nr:OmpA family protein [Magnetospirillum sp.]
MAGSRRDFLLRFAAAAVAAAGGGCGEAPVAETIVAAPLPERGPPVVYGPPPGGWPVDVAEFVALGDRVYFARNHADLDAKAKAILDRQIAWLKAHPGVAVTIEGHTDNRGTSEYNLALGDRHARAVKNYMVAMGLPAARIATVSYGKERPVAQGDGEAIQAQNRRAVTVPRGR